VIQSYLALTRREARNRDSATLRETEANVQVLSAAYRFALTDQGLRPVPVALFLGELFSNMIISARSTDQRIVGRADTAAQLDVDRAIPLGLAIAEVTYSILRVGSPAVLIQATDDSVGNLHLVVSTISDAGQVRLNDRTLAGLRLQLAAVEDRLRENELLRWVVGRQGANGKD
jgi:two-component sensor histidine kinase